MTSLRIFGILFGIFTGNNAPNKALVLAFEKSEQFLVDQGLSAFQQEHNIIIGDDRDAKQILLVERVVGIELFYTGIVELRGELFHSRLRGGHGRRVGEGNGGVRLDV